MASTGTPPLAERQDIHKSCKSLETLLGVLNDYCEAATAVALLQKKLAKALKETAGLKVTGEIPANALNICASIFETLSDIDTRFSKFADKEYDGVSNEVRKWFKKLAKEEKTHDEKIANANARIKQAGQTYERKSKKSSRDAGEEHIRYINLISTLGPEVSQEKHNHALQVTQRHAATTYSVAACLSRVANAEWLKSCDGVRRFAPSVGQLGEWWALCEGGWMGAIPQGLPDFEESENSAHNGNVDDRVTSATREDVNRPMNNREVSDQSNRGGSSSTGHTSGSDRGRDHPPSTVGTSSGQQFPRPRQSHPTLSIADQSQDNSTSSSGPSSFQDQQGYAYDSERDGGTLASFPTPPTHLPLPFSMSSPTPKHHLLQPQPSRGKIVSPVSSQAAESLFPDDLNSSKHSSELNDSPISLTPSDKQARAYGETSHAEPSNPVSAERASPQDIRPKPRLSADAYRKNDSPSAEHEFGLGMTDNRGTSRSADSREKLHNINRSDTAGSSGSIVAAMRHRYSSQPGTSPPVPKEVPRLPLSVTDLASRYRPVDEQSPPRQGTVSPPNNRQLPYTPLDSSTQSPPQDRARFPNTPIKEESDAHLRRQLRIDERNEMEFREKELREREREIEARARELEREREQLMKARGDDSNMQGGSPRPPPSPSPQRPRSRLDFPTSPPSQARLSPHLVPPSASPSQAPPNPRSRQTSLSVPPSQSRSQSHSPAHQPVADHAPYCGCDQCSVAKYKERSTTPSPHDLRPPETPINLRPVPEKPKSWMRRLSMPVAVGNAFSLDSKKSSATLRNVLEDGRIDRRSYEAGGMNNRSMTNLRR